MNIQFLPVTAGNREEALQLSVAPGQEGTVETVEVCLSEAAERALWRPVLLLVDGTAVGFAMYGLWESEGTDGRVWLDRFLIDRHFQGRGLAKAILPELIAHIRTAYGRQTLYLSVYADNRPAITLYERLGFQRNGELDENGEEVMVLR